MFLKFKRSILVLACLLLSSPAFAALEIGLEPYLGYGVAGSIGIPNATSDSYSGVAVGARAVLKFAGMFFVGPDFLYLPSMSYTSATSQAYTQSPTNLKFGAMAGINLPFPLRFWLGYNFIDNFNYSTSLLGIATSSQYCGSSWKIGAGFSILPFLSINAEYIANNNTLSGKVILLSVSAPLALPF